MNYSYTAATFRGNFFLATPRLTPGCEAPPCTEFVHPEAADKRFRVLISQANRVLTYREQRSNTGRYPVQCAGQRSSQHIGNGVRVMVGGRQGPA